MLCYKIDFLKCFLIYKQLKNYAVYAFQSSNLNLFCCLSDHYVILRTIRNSLQMSEMKIIFERTA
jgi:hypothetical protein